MQWLHETARGENWVVHSAKKKKKKRKKERKRKQKERQKNEETGKREEKI